MKYNIKGIAVLIIIVTTLLLFLQFTYNYDNKYTMEKPTAQGGIVTLTEKDITGKQPVFLIDNWFFCPGNVSQWSNESANSTYIGEFSNFKWKSENGKALGEGTYRMYIEYKGKDQVASLSFPELFRKYSLWVDETLLQSGSGSLNVDFLMKEGIHVLTLTVSADHGYYSGMYYPGAIGSSKSILNIYKAKSFLYGVAFLIPMVLSLFCFALWKRDKGGLYRKFAFLCLSFSTYVSYFFVQWWSLPFADYWYLVEDVAFYSFLYFAVAMSLEETYKLHRTLGKIALKVAFVVPLVEVLLYLLTWKFDGAVGLHGIVQDCYRLFIFICLVLVSLRVGKSQSKEKTLVLTANCALAVGLFANLINANRHEPIYGLWQFEWCGLLLVGLFAYFMILQNKRILRENDEYQTHLEDMVEKRTEQLECVLEERRSFFSDMAHDLKAPLFATKTFIEMIRRHSVGLDPQFLFYIDQVEKKQKEMSQRVESLNELNAVDKFNTPPQRIDVAEFLNEVYHSNNPEAMVSGIHLKVSIETENLCVFAQRDKLMVVLENLIYNGIRFTPAEGSITLSAKLIEAETGSTSDFDSKPIRLVRLSVKDTGCGIDEDELPNVFNRFFVGKEGKVGGSGLGLYIVKTITEELGGTVAVNSVLGQGSEFIVMLPACN